MARMSSPVLRRAKPPVSTPCPIALRSKLNSWRKNAYRKPAFVRSLNPLSPAMQPCCISMRDWIPLRWRCLLSMCSPILAVSAAEHWLARRSICRAASAHMSAQTLSVRFSRRTWNTAARNCLPTLHKRRNGVVPRGQAVVLCNSGRSGL